MNQLTDNNTTNEKYNKYKETKNKPIKTTNKMEPTIKTKDEIAKEIWDTLSKIDVSKFIEKNNL